MKLFKEADIAKINAVAAKSKELVEESKPTNTKSINSELQATMDLVCSYFKDSEAILITSKEQLHEYINDIIECGWAGIDTETTGLDRNKDHIVGTSLYYPGGTECYVPCKHLVPIFEELYKGQLTYEEVQEEYQRIADSDVKLVFANADFDLAFIKKDFNVDLNASCYYDVILAWRVLKENERDNALKVLYNKYVLKGKGDPKKFTDFFSPAMFPYCRPEVAKLYAANDAKITFELFEWQLPYVTKTHPKCIKGRLEGISDIVWGIEFPLIKVCQNYHRNGMYIDKDFAKALQVKYNAIRDAAKSELAKLVQDQLDRADPVALANCSFKTGKDFNQNSPPQVKYLLTQIMKLDLGKDSGTGKEVLNELNLPVTNQILYVRSLNVLIDTFVEKLPKVVNSDGRIHGQLKSIGADTGRMSSADPKHAYWGHKIKLIQGRVTRLSLVA